MVEKVGFSDGVGGTAIRLSPNGSSFSNSTIRNNQIHLSRNSRGVVIAGNRPCNNLTYKHNIIDIGCQLMKVDGGLTNSNITSSTWYGRGSESGKGWGTEGAMQFSTGLVSNVLIAGNSFSAGVYDASEPQPTRFIQFSNQLPSSSNAIVEGNSFYRCKDGEISVKVRRGSVIVRGNSIYNSNSSRRGNNGAEGTREYNAG